MRQPDVLRLRPDERVKPVCEEIFQATMRPCATVGWGYQRVGALPAIYVANLRWLSGYRHPRCAREPSLTQLADVLASAGRQTISYHSEFVLAETSTVRKIANQGKILVMLNQREISARRGLIVSGPWASGKTTAIRLLGNTDEFLVRRKYPDQRDRIAVVYITTPPKGSPKKLASEFVNFLGILTGLGRTSPI